ncbi:MAG: thioesterase [Clostridiales bacterium]|nr:thioesterase [Clostridiales bacterium]
MRTVTLQVGLKAVSEELVTPDRCTKHTNPDAPGLYSTPSMVGLMEGTCAKAVKPALQPEQSTVGTAVNIRHLAKTVEGQRVRCEAELVEIDRRRLLFSVVVFNDQEVKIGEGVHERFIIAPK